MKQKTRQILIGTVMTHVVTCALVALFFPFSSNATLFHQVAGRIAWFALMVSVYWFMILPNAFLAMWVGFRFRNIALSLVAIAVTVVFTCSMTSFIVDPNSFRSYHPGNSMAGTWRNYLLSGDWFTSGFNWFAICTGGASALGVFVCLSVGWKSDQGVLPTEAD
ncbi:MAG: hypothetical protein JJU29_09015 [Verrucomicrobia bacterium]|nr:hypothetical protein [Verrucomicrobiota bacterium]MCH8511411.1 hypothetical protein [Kiritimatiellia bacterium]